MKSFMKIVNVFQPLTIFTKGSILHVSQSSKYVSDYDSMCYVGKRFKGTLMQIWKPVYVF